MSKEEQKNRERAAVTRTEDLFNTIEKFAASQSNKREAHEDKYPARETFLKNLAMQPHRSTSLPQSSYGSSLAVD